MALDFCLPSVRSFLFAACVSLIGLGAGQGLVFDRAAARARSHHGTTQLVQQRPSRLVASQPQNALQSHCVDAILLAGDPPRRPKPQGQR